MEKTLRCTIVGCEKLIEDIDGIVTGLCPNHRELLYAAYTKDALIGVCWNCNTITILESKPPNVKDNYIFSKTCKQCSPNMFSTGLNWMSLIKEELNKSTLAIGPSTDPKKKFEFVRVID